MWEPEKVVLLSIQCAIQGEISIFSPSYVLCNTKIKEKVEVSSVPLSTQIVSSPYIITFPKKQLNVLHSGSVISSHSMSKSEHRPILLLLIRTISIPTQGHK